MNIYDIAKENRKKHEYDARLEIERNRDSILKLNLDELSVTACYLLAGMKIKICTDEKQNEEISQIAGRKYHELIKDNMTEEPDYEEIVQEIAKGSLQFNASGFERNKILNDVSKIREAENRC